MAREILIADSDLADQGEFQRIFESTDCRVVFSENSDDAFFSVRLLKPDLVIAGLSLTEKTGFELCEAVKKDPDLNHIPVVLLSGIFEDIPEEDRRRVGANGVLSKPLVGEEVLTLVDRLLTKETAMAKEEEFMDRGGEWKSFADMSNADISLVGPEDLDEEIIELLEVVEEPEPRMSIDNFVSNSREEPSAEIPSIEPWARSFEEDFGGIAAEETPRGEKPSEEELMSGLEQRFKEAGEPLAPAKKEERKEEELFEKIELEEILERVEMLKPALEKEWPSEKREPEKTERAEPILPAKEPSLERDWSAEASEEKAVVSSEGSWEAGEAEEKPMGFDEFEALLKKDLGIGSVEEEGLEPLSLEEAKRESLAGIPAEREPAKKEKLEEPAEEIGALEGKLRPIEEAPEPLTSLDEFEEMLKRGLEPERAQGEGIEPFPFEEAKREVSLEVTSIEEELPELKEEAFPEFLLDELIEEFEEEVLEERDVGTVDEVAEEELDVLKEIEPLEAMAEGVVAPGAPAPIEVMAKEVAVPFEVTEMEMAVPFEEMKEVVFPQEEAREVVAPPEKLKEIVPPPVRLADKQIQDVIASGIQVMIGDFITKILPEMTQSILDLTAERIEKMVEEIVPELAEKAIQEEIKRLQRGEK